jgi:hypothetical protein
VSVVGPIAADGTVDGNDVVEADMDFCQAVVRVGRVRVLDVFLRGPILTIKVL